MKRKIAIFLSLIIVLGLLIYYLVKSNNNDVDIDNLIWTTEDNIELVDDYTKKLVEENKSSTKPYDSVNFTWEAEGTSTNWSYYTGFLMYALYKTGKYYDFVDSYYNDMITSKGELNNSHKPKTLYFSNDVDFYPQVRTLLYLSDSKHFFKYKLMIERMYKEIQGHEILPKCGNNFHHRYRWKEHPFGLDGLYMALPFMIEYQIMADKLNLKYKKMGIEDDIYSRMQWVRKYLKNKNGLYYHAIKDDGIKTNGVVWLRAIGWYAMAQVELIDDISDIKYKKEMIKQLKDFFDNLIVVQDKKTGLWKNNLYNEFYIRNPFVHYCNYYETSGSAMIAYSMLRAYNEKYLKDEKYLLSGLKAFNGIIKYNMIVDSNGYTLKNIYHGTGVGDIPETYEMCNGYLTNEAKGIAPVILANEEAKVSIFNLKH